ncbi:uncharacterized protein BP5553_09007 [Venustampulla echinocandica]|uniref:tRNA (guanine(9)-N1)-methyltransferase n=1 Tax=Venustampulla echinocandica TaxID=2656787 RepID=A0A370TDP8_9HELO|nr:uncharacterized protein BP5553_09007 [Venustampulla echinocandica]RDL32551.1 hypothetical protein BP5553_09007 [Venustampulla echinocandica]
MADIEERPSKIRKLSAPENSQDAVMHVEISGKEHHEETAANAQDKTAKSENGDNNEPESTTEKQTGEEPTLSKSQRKKLLKKQAWDAGKDYRKAKRREKHKEKQARKAEARAELDAKIANGEIEVLAPVENTGKKGPSRPIPVPLTLILDCDFDELMLEKEIISLAAQMTRCHSDNKRSPYRSHLVISSWNKRLKERFETVLANTHLAWKGVRFLEQDFEEAAKEMDGVMRGQDGGEIVGALSLKGDEALKGPQNLSQNGELLPASTPSKDPQRPLEITTPPSEDTTAPPTPEASLVYLSSDSPHTLDRLSPNTSYIIGGIVDKNRHKGLCYKRACERGIPTAKLPIGEFMTMQSRTVLTVNHVVEIMLKWLETGDWGEAFLSVIPKRKEAKLRAKKREGESKEAGDEGENKEDEGDEESGDEKDGDEMVSEERPVLIDAE